MSIAPLTWLAGPIGYRKSIIEGGVALKWDFIGGDSLGRVRRYILVYESPERHFRVISPARNGWEQAHSSQLADLFRPSAVLRSDLPLGRIVEKLRGMLTPQDLAEAASASLKRRSS